MVFKSIEFKVGLLVLASAAVLVILLMSATNWPLTAGKELKFHFDFVSDIQVGAPVHLAGVKIGKVTSVTLLGSKDYQLDDAHPKTPHAVEIQARIKPSIILRTGSKVTISSLGFVGESYLEITNGPFDQPEMAAGEPIIGDNPISIAELFQRTQKTVEIATNTAKLAQEIVTENQDELKAGIADLKKFIAQTNQSTEETLNNINELVETLNQIALLNDKRLEDSFAALNRVISQAEMDFGNISGKIENVSEELSKFAEQSTDNVDKITSDAMDLSTQLKGIAQQLDSDIPELKEEITNLLTQTQNVLNTEKPKLDNLLESFTRIVNSWEETTKNIYQIVDSVQRSGGTVGKLINDPGGFDAMQKTLSGAEETVAEIRELTRKIDKKADILKVPDFSWDYELRYRKLSETFRNEFALWLLLSKKQYYRIGLSVQGEDINYDFQFGKRFGNLTARAGFIRSKVGLGFDYGLLSRRLIFTLEGINITTKTPEIDFEALLRLSSHWGIVIGTEYIILEPEDFAGGDVGFNAGIRAVY